MAMVVLRRKRAVKRKNTRMCILFRMEVGTPGAQGLPDEIRSGSLPRRAGIGRVGTTTERESPLREFLQSAATRAASHRRSERRLCRMRFFSAPGVRTPPDQQGGKPVEIGHARMFRLRRDRIDDRIRREGAKHVPPALIPERKAEEDHVGSARAEEFRQAPGREPGADLKAGPGQGRGRFTQEAEVVIDDQSQGSYGGHGVLLSFGQVAKPAPERGVRAPGPVRGGWASSLGPSGSFSRAIPGCGARGRAEAPTADGGGWPRKSAHRVGTVSWLFLLPLSSQIDLVEDGPI